MLHVYSLNKKHKSKCPQAHSPEETTVDVSRVPPEGVCARVCEYWRT